MMHMKSRARAVRMAAAIGGLAALAGSALAGPPQVGFKRGPIRPPAPTGGSDLLPFSDNFDSYTAGTGISTNGSWELWDPTSPDGVVDSAIRFSPPNSMKTTTNSDNVQTGDITSGQWRLRAMTYMPAVNGGGSGFIILLNTFPATVNGHWSMDIQWNALTGMVYCPDFAGSPQTPILYDQWVEFKAEVDLTADTYSAWYGATQLVTNRGWSTGVLPTGGSVRIQCLDLYSQFTSDLSYDNVIVEPMTAACYPDCNADHALNVNDFVCFQAAFAGGNLALADCNHDNALNVNDFVCFQSAFAAGCSAP